MRERLMRDVVTAQLREVRGSILGPDTSRRLRMWQLDLSCGHRVDRRATYPPQGGRRANGWHPRGLSEANPSPKRALCDYCKPETTDSGPT